MISTGGQIYLSDADLSCIAIDYVQQLIGVPVDIWIVDNVYKSRRKRKLYTYSGSDPRDLVSALVKAVERGEKVLIHTTWCIAYGLQTVDAVCQALERLRDDVPRHIWIKTTAKASRIGNGSTSVKALLRSQHYSTKSNILLLQQAGFDEFDDLDANFCPSSLVAWALRACLVNVGKNNYREEIINKLLSEGYELVALEAENSADSETVKNQIKETAQQNYRQFCQAVPQVETPSDSELEELNNKKAKTPQERLIERKGKLIKRYGVEVTPELVEKDDGGWYGQLQLHYYLTVGNIYLAQRDRRSLARIQEQGLGKAFQVDLNKQQLSAKIKALQIIGIEQFFDESAEFSQASLQDWLDFVIELRFDIHAVLGVCINPEKDTAVAVAQRILKKLGLKLEFKCWRGDRSNKQRIYSGCNLNSDRREEIFEIWSSSETSN